MSHLRQLIQMSNLAVFYRHVFHHQLLYIWHRPYWRRPLGSREIQWSAVAKPAKGVGEVHERSTLWHRTM